MNESIRRQDRSGELGMPIAICLGGQVLETLPPGMSQSDVRALGARARLATEHGVDVLALEFLTVCHLHPTSSAVDCIDCEPI